MKITRDLIMAKKPCPTTTEERVDGFLACFPDGIVTLEGSQKAKSYNLYWVAQKLLSPTQWVEYQAKADELLEEYAAKTAPLQVEYQNKIAPLRTACDAKIAILWKEYVAKTATLQEEYAAKRATAFYQAFKE